MWRKIDQRQNDSGLIEWQEPPQRDGAIISLVEQEDARTGDPDSSFGATDHNKRSKVLVLMGGDRF